MKNQDPLLLILDEHCATSQSQISPDNRITSPGTPTDTSNEDGEEAITPNPHASAAQTEIERESSNLENSAEDSQQADDDITLKSDVDAEETPNESNSAEDSKQADEDITLKSDVDAEDHSVADQTEIYAQNYFNSLNNILIDQHQATCPENGICIGFTAMTSILLLGLYAIGIFGDSNSEL